jgi:hypothetical protein
MDRLPLGWQLEDPADTLTDIDRLYPFVSGRVVVASVDNELQVMVAAAPVPVDPSRGWDLDEAIGLLTDVALRLVPEPPDTQVENAPVRHHLVTVVCRRGPVTETEVEHRWDEAWIHVRHDGPVLVGEVYTVTPSGWHGVTDRRTGAEPSLRPRLSLVPLTDA